MVLILRNSPQGYYPFTDPLDEDSFNKQTLTFYTEEEANKIIKNNPEEDLVIARLTIGE